MIPNLTVVFSSFNGAGTLPTMLDAMCKLRSPQGGWQVIAVDNASTDSTRNILDSYVDRLPLVVLSEIAKGKNSALNSAIAHLEGDLVVFTDDDVVPAEDWLCQLRACADTNDGYGLFGGAISPRWPTVLPSWLRLELPLGMLYAITDTNAVSGEIDVGSVWGPNMCVRRRYFDAGVRFDVTLGPNGTATYMMGSEGEFTRRLGEMGVRAWFCQDARVEHLIRSEQITKKWVLGRFYRHGRSCYRHDHTKDSSIPRVFGIERWLLRKLLSDYVMGYFYAMLGNSEAAFKVRCSYQHLRGRFYQAREDSTATIEKQSV